MDYIAGKYPDLVPLYDEIYNKHNRSYFEALEVKAEKMAKKYDCAFVDNEMPYGRVPQGHPVIVDYFYHENAQFLVYREMCIFVNKYFKLADYGILCCKMFQRIFFYLYADISNSGNIGCKN